MRLLFLSTYFPRPLNRQIGTWALEQAQGFQSNGVETTVVSLTPSFPRMAGRFHRGIRSYSHTSDLATMGGLNVYYPRWNCYPLHPLRRLIDARPEFWLSRGWHSCKKKLLQIVDKISPDVIFANHTLVNGYVAAKLKAELGIPFVTNDHETGDYQKCQTNSSWKRVFEFVSREASLVITVSKKMECLGQSIFPEARFKTVYNGAIFAPCPDTDMARHEAGQNPVKIFCSSNFYARKDIPLLINAFDEIWRSKRNVQLRIAGNGPENKTISALHATSQSRDSIKLLGQLPREHVLREMLTADIFALVGWGEPFGVVFLEALACGTPVVLADDAGAAEVLTDGSTALFTRPRNISSVVTQLTRLVDDRDLRQRLAQNGRDLFATNFTWKHVASKYLAILQESINQSLSQRNGPHCVV